MKYSRDYLEGLLYQFVLGLVLVITACVWWLTQLTTGDGLFLFIILLVVSACFTLLFKILYLKAYQRESLDLPHRVLAAACILLFLSPLFLYKTSLSVRIQNFDYFTIIWLLFVFSFIITIFNRTKTIPINVLWFAIGTVLFFLLQENITDLIVQYYLFLSGLLMSTTAAIEWKLNR